MQIRTQLASILTSVLKLLTHPTGLRRIPVYAFVLLVGWFFLYSWWGLQREIHEGLVSYAGLRVITKRIEIPVVKELTKVKTVTQVVPVNVYAPSPSEQRHIEHLFDFKLDTDERLLGIWHTGPAPRGGDAVAKLHPDGKVDFSFKALPPKTFEFGPWTAGLGVNPLDSANWHLYGEKELRVGKVFFRADAGVEALQGVVSTKVWIDALYKF